MTDTAPCPLPILTCQHMVAPPSKALGFQCRSSVVRLPKGPRQPSQSRPVEEGSCSVRATGLIPTTKRAVQRLINRLLNSGSPAQFAIGYFECALIFTSLFVILCRSASVTFLFNHGGNENGRLLPFPLDTSLKPGAFAIIPHI